MNDLRNFTRIAVTILIVGICCQFGCKPQQPIFLGEKGLWQSPPNWKGKATDIDYPNVDNPSLPEICETIEPLTLDNPDPDAMWDLTLEEAIQMSLKNSAVIRTLSGVGFSQAGVSGAPSALLQGGNVRTVYDPALIESDPRYGQEAALAAFDAQFRASTEWGKDYHSEDTGEIRAGISKIAATGTQFYLDHVDRYNYNVPYDSSSWSSYIIGGFTHPLLRGSGIEFNRIAGPGSTVGNYGGVSIARINTDMSLNDFEMAVRNLVADVERAYWNLYYAYYRLQSVKSGFHAAHETWRQTNNHAQIGSAKGSAHQLAQAEQNYFEFRGELETAQNNLFAADTMLRYAIGLSVSDGRLIRPIDEPITAPIRLDWHNILCEALFRSPELRKQKWTVKQRELEVIASKNFLLPQLDLEGGYRFSGSGEKLIGASDSAYGTMAGSGWTVGLNATAPFGWRRELAGVRNAQLNLARARKILQEQEFELSHQLGESFRAISTMYRKMQTALATYQAASREVTSAQNAYDAERATLDLVLQAQRRQSAAETSYYNSVMEYNLAIMTLHHRKGSLLEYNNVCLTEGEWPAKAYFDAKRRARERDAGRYFNYGVTLPSVVSRGTYRQHQHDYNSALYDALPTVLPNEDSYLLPPPPPTSEPFNVIETDSTIVIPTPVLPKPGGTTPVSFSTSENTAPMPASALTPARTTRNMRYVQ